MKVLFASLSRIGDYLQHLVIIKAWATQNPNWEVHLLVNDLIPHELIRMNSQFKHIVLPRFEYQKKINQVSVPLLFPYLALRKLVQQLRLENYTQMFDLSYQAYSLGFLKLINPTFSYSKKEVQLINDYLNLADSEHLIDKIKAVYGLKIEPMESEHRSISKLLFQVVTSDDKKNIDLSKWRGLFDRLKTDFPSLELSVLCSRSERKQLKQVFSDSEITICNFSELAQIFNSQTSLVSLDTSIKHFATQFHVPTIEISIGSSHWIKNAAYQSGNFIFSANFYCRPCAHSQKCPLGRNQCQDEINFSDLHQFIGLWVEDRWLKKPALTALPMKTINQNSNLSYQGGDKWNLKTGLTNQYL